MQEPTIESKETLRKLREYLANGYLLHGSKHKRKILEPRQAGDTRKERITGKQRAVYASDDVEVPLFMALIDKKDPNASMHSGYIGHDGYYRMYGDTNATLTKGYVYVLSKDTFEIEDDGKGDTELISRVPVTPVAIVEVTPDIFGLLGTVTLKLDS